MKKIVICGGHLTPALALIEELGKQKDCKIYFFGRKYTAEGSKSISREFQKINSQKIDFYIINTGRLQRKITRRTATSLIKIPKGILKSLYLLNKLKPDVVMSFGGYVALPVVLGARLLGIKVVVHEQSTVLGLTNRITSTFANKIFLTFSDTKKVKNQNVEVIGNLERKSLFQKTAKDKNLNNFLKDSENLIYITGGNQGSHFINNLIFESLNKLNDFKILHQVGILNHKGDLDKAKDLKSEAYYPIDYIKDEDIGAIFEKAKIIISRAGANTVWEIAVHAKPAILIPLPISAADEQKHNAQILESKNAAILLEQKDATFENLKKSIDQIENSYAQFKSNAQKYQKTLPKDAASKLARYLLSLT